jgi:hypothetical protein
MTDSALELFCRLHGIAVPDTISDDIIMLEVEGLADVWLLDLGEGVGFEVFVTIEGLDTDDPAVLKALMEANYLGMGTEGGRVDLDPMGGGLALCERWTLARLLHAEARDDLARFAARAKAWREEAVPMIMAAVREGQGGRGLPAEGMLRL